MTSGVCTPIVGCRQLGGCQAHCVPHAGDELAVGTRRMQRDAVTVTGDDVPRIGQPAHLDLQSLERRIDVARRATGTGFFSQHVPRLDRLPQFEMHAALHDFTGAGETGIRHGAQNQALSKGNPAWRNSKQEIVQVLFDKVR